MKSALLSRPLALLGREDVHRCGGIKIFGLRVTSPWTRFSGVDKEGGRHYLWLISRGGRGRVGRDRGGFQKQQVMGRTVNDFFFSFRIQYLPVLLEGWGSGRDRDSWMMEGGERECVCEREKESPRGGHWSDLQKKQVKTSSTSIMRFPRCPGFMEWWRLLEWVVWWRKGRVWACACALLQNFSKFGKWEIESCPAEEELTSRVIASFGGHSRFMSSPLLESITSRSTSVKWPTTAKWITMHKHCRVFLSF